MVMIFLGFWLEFGWRSSHSSVLQEITEYCEESFSTEPALIEYLNSGIPVASLRSAVSCPFTGSMMKSPVAYTDGQLIWTNAYIHYLSKGVISLDKEVEKHIRLRHFKLIQREDLSMDQLDFLDKYVF